ncbi:MAG TPA: carboxypeptidase regulatory-like domain-containing protein [Candidatus Dormibacteraeota bacterium]|nr:carboxypeptidase regulatory-like domain-containing protein [Candidatus Dormibacteraeota bacterium]
MKRIRKISGGVLAVALLGWASAILVPRQVRAATPAGLLTGSVQSVSGGKMAGVTVSAKREGSNITTSVFTDTDGDYYFPPMHAGKYKVWAQADSYQYTNATVDLRSLARQDFVLKPMAHFIHQLTGDQLLAALPDSTPSDRRLKWLFRNNCTSCHQPNYILQNRFNEAGWTAVLNLMREINIFGVSHAQSAALPVSPGTSYILTHEKELEKEPHFAGMQFPYINNNKQALAAYLARIRGPGPSALKIHLRPRPTGKAARVVFTEYDLPVDSSVGYPYKYVTNNGSNWSLGTPSGFFGNFGIHDAVADPEGNIWFTYAHPNVDITIGRVDAKSGAVKFFKIPGRHGLATGSHGITRDLHGNLWFNIGPGPDGQPAGIAMVDPTTQKIQIFYPPKGMTGAAGTIDTDAKGNVWVTTDIGALRFNPVIKHFREFKSPTFINAAGVGTTYGLTVDSEGNGWWAQMPIDIIDKADIKTGKVVAIQLPPVKSQLDNATPEDRKLYAEYGADFNTTPPGAQGPRRLGADKHGNSVWVCDWWGGNLAKININTLKVTIVPFPQPDAQQPYQSKVDDHHRVWVDMMNSDSIMEYDPQASRWTEYPLPTLGTENRYIDLLEKGGSLQQVILPYFRARKVVRMTFRTKTQIQALKKQIEQREQAAM